MEWLKLDVNGEERNIQIVKRAGNSLDLEIGPTSAGRAPSNLAAKIVELNLWTLRRTADINME